MRYVGYFGVWFLKRAAIYKGRKHDTPNVPADKTLQGLLRASSNYLRTCAVLLTSSVGSYSFYESRYIEYANYERNTAIVRYYTLAKDSEAVTLAIKQSEAGLSSVVDYGNGKYDDTAIVVVVMMVIAKL